MTAPEVRGQLEVGDDRVDCVAIAPPGAFAAATVAHGAGAAMDHPLMVGFCRRLSELGVATLRFNFPYAQKGRRAPDPEPRLRAAWSSAFEETRRRFPGLPVFACGKSLGGRIGSMCVADGMEAAGVVFLGYPLHPPGKTDRIRDQHLYRIRVPLLFLQGTSDPFAQPALLKGVLTRLGDLAEHRPVEGGDHSFNVRGAKRDPRDVGAGLADMALPFLTRVAGAA